jgi:hypothetical protein
VTQVCPRCQASGTAPIAAADLPHPKERRELGDSDARPWRSKFAAENFRDRLGETLEQLVRMVDGKSLQTLHVSRVVERVLETTALEYPCRRQLELEIQQQRLWQMLFPFVDADAGLDAQIVDENPVHGRWKQEAS